LPFREFATRELNDPWDMSQRTDRGWFTWGSDLPGANMPDRRISSDAPGNVFFSGNIIPTSADPSIFLLDTWVPGAAKLGKTGANFPIDTTVYNVLYVKMKVANEVLGQGPVAQVFWSRDSIYYDPASRPGGGTIAAVNAIGNQSGVFLTPTTSQPYGSLEGGHWVIYRIPMTLAELRSQNSVISHWGNLNGGANANWGSPGVYADSFRLSPLNLTGSVVGQIQIDWARLVSHSTGNATTVSWTGGGAYDVVVSTRPDCSDFAVMAYSVSTGYQFQSQILPPGVYRIGLRRPFTVNGQTTPGGNAVSCSSSTITVQAYPSLVLTSPNEEGSADDFATSFLSNAWDFDAFSDVDYSRNLTFPDATFGIVYAQATDTAGIDLGSVRLFRNRSIDVGAGIGDPHIYPLWPIPSPPAPAGVRARGLLTHIDASRYRILTAELGVERARDINLGSVARIIWHVAGDVNSAGNLAEIESSDIVLRHVDPAENGGRVMLDKVQLDMADRRSLAVESDTTQSASGWGNVCKPSSGFTCNTGAPGYRPGVDIFRLDFHEFGPATASSVRRIKLAALERTGASFQVRWTAANPDGLAATVSLRAVPEANPAAGNHAPAGCTAAASVTIASGLPLGSGGYTWTPGLTAGVGNGTEYYVCAQVSVAGVSGPVAEAMSRWPVVVDTSFAGLAPTLQLDRTTLRLAGISTPQGLLGSRTQPETIRFAQNGPGVVNWTASVVDNGGSPINWLSLSPASGAGSGAITVSLRNDVPFPVCTATDGYQAAIRITSPEIGNSPLHVQVYVTVYPGAGTSPPAGCARPAGASAPPFGQIDTPVQNAAGIVGAIAVTGWALDDVGVSGVKIYRNCLSFEDPRNCQTVAGHSVVYVGNAAFLAGARPDVEAAFGFHPVAFRAGWGYLMLTAMLPHVPAQLAYGGQGPVTLFAVAQDAEGHETLLGRSQVDRTPTSITLANDTIAKPFGAIDTPGQGQTVSGTVVNFGWALTPDSDRAPGGGDILIPTDGSTMTVFIDGAPVGHVAYNQCRGDGPNPVPAGLYCNDDIANIFGQPAPQPVLTPRASNPTLFRNLDAGRAAIGAFVIDTARLTNGMHTIAWGVTDTAGRPEGIGSRFFNVLNGAADERHVAADASLMPAAGEADLAALELFTGTVTGRSSFDLQSPWEVIQPAGDGRRYARIPELGRLELSFGPDMRQAYLEVDGKLRPLPAGSRLRDGRFTWSPGPGYVGEYRLVFVGEATHLPVSVRIDPAGDTPRITAYIDDPVNGATVTGPFRLAGWAAELTAWNGSGIGAVHVWAQRRDRLEPAVFLGAAETEVERPDVAAAVGPQFGRAGWSLITPRLAPGTYDVTAYFWSARTGRFEDARTVTITAK
jgi:hypothetical protein